MTYRLEFREDALKEWRGLDGYVRKQFKKKLEERLENPHVLSARLRGSESRYKIKLRAVGYRLVYEVNDVTVIVTVVGVGHRDKNKIYEIVKRRR